MEYSIGLLHGVLLDYFWTTFGVPHPSLVLMTVASFLLLRAHVVNCALPTRAPWEPSLPIPNHCIVQLLVMQSVLILSPCKPLLCNNNK